MLEDERFASDELLDAIETANRLYEKHLLEIIHHQLEILINKSKQEEKSTGA